jgi:hypothetical protein
MKPRKFDYFIILQGHYGRGWEDLCAADDDAQGLCVIRQHRREYRDNEGGSYRIIRRRVLVGSAS